MSSSPDIRSAAAELPAGEPLIAIRMDDETLRERRLPTRHDLDLAADDRPVLVYRYCGHIAVANTRALETAGIGSIVHRPDRRDPGSRRIRASQRDPAGNRHRTGWQPL